MSHALRKKELCESVISVMDLVIPGRFRMRGKILVLPFEEDFKIDFSFLGMFLSEMYGILFFLAKKAFENGDIDRRQFLNRLENAKLVLEESMEVRKNQCCQLMKIFENHPQCGKNK